MLCEKCSNIHFRRLGEWEIVQQNPRRFNKSGEASTSASRVFYFHHESKVALRNSADNGCHFCQMLFSGLFETKQRGRWNYGFKRGGVILRRSIVDKWLKKPSGFAEWNRLDWIYVSCEDKCNTTTNILELWGSPHPENPKTLTPISNTTVASLLEALTACANLDGCQVTKSPPDQDGLKPKSNPILSTADSRLCSPWLDVSTMSPASMNLARAWLDNCLEHHFPCRDGQPHGTLPTRIINVSDPRKPHLEGGYQRCQPYVTLSYKWGDGRRYLTTTQNVQAHQREIPLQHLPATFKDAIHVAHTLGYEWLWIDALCILQDCEEDRKREMGVMDEIFRCSILTLFAAAGDSVDAGLSATRDPRDVKPCLLQLTTTLDGQTVKGPAYVKVDSGSGWHPLFSRAWVLQEQVLATRGLIFGSAQLRWRCLCESTSESRPGFRGKIASLKDLGTPQYGGMQSYSGGYDGFNLLRMWIQKKNPLPDRGDWRRDNHYDHWYDLIEGYSNRQLTYSADVLPAVSGLANALSKTQSCTYLAGLWEEDMHIGLTWYVSEGPDRFSASHYYVDRAKLHVPSWSWASQWGKALMFRFRESESHDFKHEGLSILSNSDHESASGVTAGDRWYRTALTVQGSLRAAILMRGRQRTHQPPGASQDWFEEKALFLRLIADPDSGTIIGQIALDSDLASDQTLLVHCLLCSVRAKDDYGRSDDFLPSGYSDWALTCLGLVPTDDTFTEFTRIGLVFLRERDWFGDVNQVDLNEVGDHDPSRQLTMIHQMSRDRNQADSKPSRQLKFVRTVRLV